MARARHVSTSGSGSDVLTAMFFVFLVLKLTGVIGWSWWWVTAPAWGGALVVVLFALVYWFRTVSAAMRADRS